MHCSLDFLDRLLLVESLLPCVKDGVLCVCIYRLKHILNNGILTQIQGFLTPYIFKKNYHRVPHTKRLKISMELRLRL